MSIHLFVANSQTSEDQIFGLSDYLFRALKMDDRLQANSDLKLQTLPADEDSIAQTISKADIKKDDQIVLTGTAGIDNVTSFVPPNLVRSLDRPEVRESLSRAQGVYLAVPYHQSERAKQCLGKSATDDEGSVKELKLGEMPDGIFSRFLSSVLRFDVFDDGERGYLNDKIFNAGEVNAGVTVPAGRILDFIDVLSKKARS